MLPLALAAALHVSLAAPPARPPRGPAAARDAAPADPFDPSAYPPEQRAGVVLFREKCAKCHVLAVAAASRQSASELRRHLRRPGFALSTAQARSISEFLELHDARRRASP